MVDNVSSERRSQIMARIRSKNTSPEIRVRRVAHALGLRFRLHRQDLPGRPDLVFPRHRTVVFVHGCYWHQHRGCKRSQLPKSAQDFWSDKFSKNLERDARNEALLKKQGWSIIVIWECETKTDEAIRRALRPIIGSVA
jgi:DNA mismatch endonuclease (patch repair protein)